MRCAVHSLSLCGCDALRCALSLCVGVSLSLSLSAYVYGDLCVRVRVRVRACVRACVRVRLRSRYCDSVNRYIYTQVLTHSERANLRLSLSSTYFIPPPRTPVFPCVQEGISS